MLERGQWEGRRLGGGRRSTFFDLFPYLGTDKDCIERQPRKSTAQQMHPGFGIEFAIDNQVGSTAIAAKPTLALKVVVAHLNVQPGGEGFKFLPENGSIH